MAAHEIVISPSDKVTLIEVFKEPEPWHLFYGYVVGLDFEKIIEEWDAPLTQRMSGSAARLKIIELKPWRTLYLRCIGTSYSSSIVCSWIP